MHAMDAHRSYALSTRPGLARRELRDLLAREHWPGDVDGVVLAVHEALVNSERYAGGATAASAALGEGGALVVDVRDHGPGFELTSRSAAVPGPLAEQGRGLFLIRELAKSAEVEEGPGEIRLRMLFHGQ